MTALAVAGAVGGWAALRPGGAPDVDIAGTSAAGVPTPGMASPGRTPIASPTPSPAPSRLKMRWYDSGQGWKAAVPRGWKLTIRQNQFTWSDREGIAYLGVQFIDAGGRKPLDLLREAESSLSGAVRKYRKIRLAKVPARRDPPRSGATSPITTPPSTTPGTSQLPTAPGVENPGAARIGTPGTATGDSGTAGKRAVLAEWESTWTGPGYHSWAVSGVAYHEIQRMIVTGDKISVVDWTTTKAEWERLKPTMDAVFKLYRAPAPPTPE